MFGSNSYFLAEDTYYLRRPFQPISTKAPDVGNFYGSSEMGRQVNWFLSMMKFLPQFEVLAYAGKKKAEEGEGHQIKFYDDDMNDCSWWVTDEWYDAFNEYSAPANIYNNYVPSKGIVNNGYTPATNSDVLEWYYNNNNKGLNWHKDYVFGFHHFNIDIRPDKYWWGEGRLGGCENIDGVFGADEWNHIGVTGNADKIDPRWSGDVDKPIFCEEYLGAINSNWEKANALLKSKFDGLSFYQIVMNSVKGAPSYLDLSGAEMMETLALAIEARNRTWLAAEEVFGPADSTWNDGEMISNFRDWLSRNRVSIFSPGIDVMRLFLGVQHSFVNQISMFSGNWEHGYHYGDPSQHGYNVSALDHYCFRTFVNNLGRNYYDGGNNKGLIYNYIGSQVDLSNSDIDSFLRGSYDLGHFSIHTKPQDIPLPSALNNLDEGTKTKLRAFKWLLENWFGASKVRAGYNSIPKWERYQPGLDMANTDHWTDIEGFKVPISITDKNSARSYAWDRVTGPFHAHTPSWGHAFQKTDDSWVEEGTTWVNFYNKLRDQYGYELGYSSPHCASHKNYTRSQFSKLGMRDMKGYGAKGEVFHNSWPVYIEGMLYTAGQEESMRRVWNWLSANALMKKAHEKDLEAYDDAKERIEWNKKMEQKVAAKKKAQSNSMQKKFDAKLQQKRKSQKQEFQKSINQAFARKRADNKRFFNRTQAKKTAKKS